MTNTPQIGSLNEKALHAALKQWYAQPDDQFEVPVDGFVIDIVRGEQLIEIQTRNFSAMKRKLVKLTATHPVRLVHPIAQEKWIVKLANDEQSQLSRRKSPKRGDFVHLFQEMLRIPHLMGNDNFTLEILLIKEEEVRRHEANRAWRRRGWVTHERKLLEVVNRKLFEAPEDLGTFIPDTLDGPFTTADLAKAIRQPRPLAQKIAYTLRAMEVITQVGKRGRSYLYERAHLTST
ncbi:MAG: hypothetical protein AAF485_01820 [Chloroflexota bacterium]